MTSLLNFEYIKIILIRNIKLHPSLPWFRELGFLIGNYLEASLCITHIATK